MAIDLFGAWFDDPDFFFRWIWHGQNTVWNLASYKSAEMDRFSMPRARSATAPPMQALVKQFVKLAMTDVPVIPLYQPLLDVVCSPTSRATSTCFIARSTRLRCIEVRREPRSGDMKMGTLAWTVLRRLLLGCRRSSGVVVVSFVLTRLLPGDPAVYFAGAAPTPEAIADLRRMLMLDRPMWEQFLSYLSELAHGNLGRSLVTGQPVLRDLAARLPATLELTVTAIALALLISVPLGIAAALRQGRPHRSRLPAGLDHRALHAIVLHRAAVGVCLLLPAGHCPRSARTHGSMAFPTSGAYGVHAH